MFSEVVSYLTVFFTSMFKFVFGPFLGVHSELTFFETTIFTVTGMMTTVVLFSFLGQRIKKFYFKNFLPNRKLFTSKNRKIIKFWRRHGLKGVAFLTPILFSPILGTMVASSFGESRKRIFIYMLGSSIFWAFLLTFIFIKVSHLPQVKQFLGSL